MALDVAVSVDPVAPATDYEKMTVTELKDAFASLGRTLDQAYADRKTVQGLIEKRMAEASAQVSLSRMTDVQVDALKHALES